MISPLAGLSVASPLAAHPIQRPGRTPAGGQELGRESTPETGPSSGEPESTAEASSGTSADPATGLTPEEEQIVAELTATDRQVRAHEQAHLAAASGLAGGVSFTYTTGPDGKQYAVGGEVSIDTSPVHGDPAATIRKAQQIRAAANAPANPSGQDRAVSAQASQMEAAARQELAEQTRTELEERNRSAKAGAYSAEETALSSAPQLSLIA